MLRSSGSLPTGRVVGVEQTTTPQHASQTARVSVRYSPDAPPSAPARLFLKTTRPATSTTDRGRGEVSFYTRIADRMPVSPAPRCFHAAHSAEEKRFDLLLEDLSETHHHSEWPLPPHDRQCQDMVDALASFHAWWWGREDFDESLEHPRDYDWEQAKRGFDSVLPRFVDFLGDRLSAKGRGIYERLLPGAVQLFEKRLRNDRNLTLLHGDAHFWNVLHPRAPDANHPVFVDWDECGIGCGAMDLVYTIGLHWYPERRARLETPLLRRYHAVLLANGVSSYAWEELLDDYRLFALRNLLIPPGQWDRGLGAYIWWGHLERALLTAEDLGALELL